MKTSQKPKLASSLKYRKHRSGKRPGKNDIEFHLRLPAEQHTLLVKLAEAERLSLNNFLLASIQRGIAATPQPILVPPNARAV